jgi:hypothetical protein
MAEGQAQEPSEYVLLHRDTGLMLYRTQATEQEILRVNQQFKFAGNRGRFVAARFLMHP